MSRKKIAVFSTGWASDILSHFMEGMRDGLKDYDADMYLFMSYASFGDSENNRHSELNIFNLPDMSWFDGAILVSNLIDFPGYAEEIARKCHEANIPVISHGRIIPGIPNVVTDNIAGTRELTEHLIKVHGVKRIAFFAGAADNADSNERLSAVKEVCEQNGIVFDDNDVIYTNWDFTVASMAAMNFINNDNLPDAFVCANDEIAMVIAVTLDENKLVCPKDSIITGFDHITASQVFYPSIASVNQDLYNHGIVCAKSIKDAVEGQNIDDLIKIPCKFIPGESCGCPSDPVIVERRMKAGTISFKIQQLANSATWHAQTIERIVMKCESYREIKHDLTENISKNHGFEGDNFHILFDPDSYMSEVKPEDTFSVSDDYSSRVDVIFSLRNGKVQNIRSINTRTLVPGISEDDEKHLYVFLPVHEREKKVGYVVFVDCYDRIESKAIREYMERFNSAIEKARKAMYLKAINDSIRELSHIDALTHVKNRAAYESYLETIRQKAEAKRKIDFGIILFDVNNLKKINDKLGHYAGDEYIKNACKLICLSFKNSPVYRIGGDEFVVILDGKAFEQRDRHLDDFVREMNLARNNEELTPEERVSIAYGMSVYQSGEESVDDCIKRADEMMYGNKKKMKEESLH